MRHFLILTALAIGGCDGVSEDRLYALWGLSSDKVIFEKVDVHDFDGDVVLHRTMTIAPTLIDDCRVGLTLAGTEQVMPTGETTSIPTSSWVIDYRKASTIAFEWQPDPAEAKLFTDPKHMPAWTPRKYLKTHLSGDGAICLEDGNCPPTAGPLAVITDPTVTAELVKAAFDRLKGKCT